MPAVQTLTRIINVTTDVEHTFYLCSPHCNVSPAHINACMLLRMHHQIA